MGPKVEAALRFVEGGAVLSPRPAHRRAVVTSLEHIADAVAGDVGTTLSA
jgi:carbamate kinase